MGVGIPRSGPECKARTVSRARLRASRPGGERATQPEPDDVAPQVALQATSAQGAEELLLVVHAIARQQPVAARTGSRRDDRGEAVAHAGGEVEPGLVERLDRRYLAAREQRVG